jgi:L-fucose mutarotase
LLKNIDPLLSGALLTTIDSMRPGDWLTLAGSDFPGLSEESAIIDVGDATIEAAATAILSIMPLDDGGESPIVFLDSSAGEGELPDVAYAVRGIAADAELRRVTMSCLEPVAFAEAAAHSVLTVTVGRDRSAHAFLLRKGHC